MSLHPTPLQDHGEGFFTWHAYDPSCKAELWSTAYFGNNGTVLFDPIDWPKEASQPKQPVLIVKTNENHDRGSTSVAQSFQAQITPQPTDFASIVIPGAGEGETAYFHEPTSTLVVGDALIHLAPNPLMPLPDKYCTNPEGLKTSLRKLLDYPVRRIFFAHGAPILQDGQQQIRKLLS